MSTVAHSSAIHREQGVSSWVCARGKESLRKCGGAWSGDKVREKSKVQNMMVVVAPEGGKKLSFLLSPRRVCPFEFHMASTVRTRPGHDGVEKIGRASGGGGGNRGQKGGPRCTPVRRAAGTVV